MIPNCFLAQRYPLAECYNIGAKYFFYSSPFYHNKQKYAQYEIMISYFVIFEGFLQLFKKKLL